MGRKGKKFIDKKIDNVYSFRIGARSQRDPLAADETAPQGVLIDETLDAKDRDEEQKYGIYFDDDYDYLKHLRCTREGINWNDNDLEVYEIRKEDPQANKKEVRNKRLKLPSSVFESYVEEPIGLLNKAAPITGPCPELDPDVVAHLDDALPHQEDVRGVENILEMLGGDGDEGEWEDVEDEEIWGSRGRYEDDEMSDNYHKGEDMDEMPPLEELDEDEYPLPETIIKQGRDSCSDDSSEEGDCWSTTGADRDNGSEYNVSDDEERDQLGGLGASRYYNYDNEDTKSHFTEYSLTSSVVRRNKQLTDLDDQFQAMYIREYKEEQIGALDGEDIDGYLGEKSELYQQTVDRTNKQFSKKDSLDDGKDWIVKWIQDQEQKIETGQIVDHENEEIQIEERNLDHKWDCQSVLSTYSNLYNHPTLLDKPTKKIAIHPVTGMPMEATTKGLTKKALQLHNGDDDLSDDPVDTRTILSTISAISIRPPGETSEERSARKSALKELRRERRIEKKNNKLAFKDEKKKQERVNLNKPHCNIVKVV